MQCNDEVFLTKQMLSHVKASNTAFNLEAHLIGSSGIRTHDLSLPSELPCFGVWDHLYNREKLDLRLTKYLFQFKYCLRTSKHVLKASNNFSFQELFFWNLKFQKFVSHCVPPYHENDVAKIVNYISKYKRTIKS